VYIHRSMVWFFAFWLFIAVIANAAKDIAIGSTSNQVVATAGNRPFISIQNKSDAPLFLKFDGSTNSLSSTNGYRLDAGVTLFLVNDAVKPVFTHNIHVLNTNALSKTVNIQGED
jgi:hypothetical protein